MNKTLKLRELSIEDIEMVKKFFTAVFTKEPWNDDWSNEEQLHAYITDLTGNRNSLTLGFFEGDDMVGLSMGHIKHWYEGTEYYIDELCIKSEVQGKGYGTQFVLEIKKCVKAKGMTNIFLLTENNVPAYQFYKKNGFSEIENHVAFFTAC